MHVDSTSQTQAAEAGNGPRTPQREKVTELQLRIKIQNIEGGAEREKV